MAIATNSLVSISYQLRDLTTGEIIDSNIGEEPFEFILGRGEIIKGLENRIKDMSIGESAYIVVSPEEGYGVYDPELVDEVSRDQFLGIDLKVGMSLYGRSESGDIVQVTVKDFNSETVFIDYNHPLAGKELGFDIKILDAKELDENELYGSCCGGYRYKDDECCNGEHHQDGECCGRHHH